MPDGTVLLGRYQLRGVLGRGGMAVVLAADDALLGREVALKVMLPNLSSSPEAVERFLTAGYVLNLPVVSFEDVRQEVLDGWVSIDKQQATGDQNISTL